MEGRNRRRGESGLRVVAGRPSSGSGAVEGFADLGCKGFAGAHSVGPQVMFWDEGTARAKTAACK